MYQFQKKSSRFFVVAVVLAIATTALPVQRTSVRRVRLSRGRTTAILQGSVINDATKQYVLDAKAGQTLIVHVTSPRGLAQFDVYPKNDRQAFADTAEDVKDWEGRLPKSGDYVISVYSIRGNTRYTLEVTIR